MQISVRVKLCTFFYMVWMNLDHLFGNLNWTISWHILQWDIKPMLRSLGPWSMLGWQSHNRPKLNPNLFCSTTRHLGRHRFPKPNKKMYSLPFPLLIMKYNNQIKGQFVFSDVFLWCWMVTFNTYEKTILNFNEKKKRHDGRQVDNRLVCIIWVLKPVLFV